MSPFLVQLSVTAALADAPVLHHDVQVVLEPEAGRLAVVDRLSGVTDQATFALHAGLAPTVATRGWRLERVEDATRQAPVDIETWRLVTKKKKPKLPVEIRYAGPIVHPIETQGEEYQRSFSETPGTIQSDGVYLAGSSMWLPDFGEPFGFTIAPSVPAGWSAVVSGNPTDTGWNSAGPSEEAYLVAAAWDHTAREVTTPSGTRGIDVYLREPDPGLTFRYTEATARYLSLYEGMLTPYPFERFALVENFWETGYGMPGFTLLGPQVIRFPWVLTSSYPHEILHTWWGNSATIDPAGGNWAEGLTAYMADHLFAEHRGQDAQYRRSTLKKFTDLAADADFPLVEFQGRTSAATEAVGYGKSLMFWHMLRRHIGDEAFLKGLRAFHDAHRFAPAGFRDLEPFLSEASGTDLGPYFEAWTTTSGAVRLEVESLAAVEDGNGWRVKGRLTQADPGKPAWIPLRITTANGRHAVMATVALEGGAADVDVPISAEQGEPLRVDVDPEFDVMRILDPLEVPPALTSVFGEPRAVFVMPSRGTSAEREAWKQLAEAWAKPGTPELVEDDTIAAPPPGSWVLGWENLHGAAVAERVTHAGAKVSDAGLAWEGETFGRDHSTVLVARSDDPERALGWVTAGDAAAIPGLARKLPHYTKYSLLAFSGEAPDNVAKATWEPLNSPLTVNLTKGDLVPAKVGADRPALAEMPPRFDAAALLADASWFGDPARGGRGLGSPGLAESTDRIAAELASIGVSAERETWTAEVDGKSVELTNVVATLPGSGRPLEPVLVMAHVDHLGTGEADVREGNAGKVHPGADDNASGIAVALAVLKTLASEPPRPRPVRFVFTTAEEHGLQGAKHHLGAGDAPFACVSLDTVGRLGEGGKVTIAGAETAKELRFLFMGVGYTTGTEFAFAQPGIAGSDHAACHAVGVPGVQVTTGAHADYHSPTDTVDKLDADGMVEVADAVLEAVAYLAERTDPLTVQLGGSAPAAGEGGPRKASLGTMPDFAFEGPGVRVADVMPGSAAGAAGIHPGDILVSVDGEDLRDVRGFSEVLKSRRPGDEVRVRVRRGTETLEFEVELAAR